MIAAFRYLGQIAPIAAAGGETQCHVMRGGELCGIYPHYSSDLAMYHAIRDLDPFQ